MKKTITFMLLLLMAGAAMSQGTFTCGEQISDVEGNTYETVEIGGLCWTKENMKSKTYADGSAIAKAMIYNSSMHPDTNANLATYGRLYTWFSAVNVPEGSSSKPTRNADGFVQGICPDGWHIPTVGEMNKLNTNSTESLRSVELWLQPNNNTNSTGFSSLPAGYYSNTTNRFEVLLGYTYYWSDSSSTPEFAIAGDVNYYCDVAKNEQKTTGDGVSVRCVKDYSLSANTFTCGTDKVTDVEGHDYNTVKIGNQCWMRQNLRTTKYANGTAITAGGTTTSTSTPYYYDYTASNIDLKDRGLLYNWSAATRDTSSNSFPSGVQGICPDGWHLPSDAEWNLMEKFVSGSDTMNVNFNATGYRGSHAGKLAGGDKWNSVSSGNVPGNMDYAERNASGFSAVPAGYCDGSSFGGAGVRARFWSSTQDGRYDAWRRDLGYYSASVGRYYASKYYGYSVRCLRDGCTNQ